VKNGDRINSEEFLNERDKLFENHANPALAYVRIEDHKESGYQCIGIPLTTLRKVYRPMLKHFQAMSEEQQWFAYEQMFKRGYEEDFVLAIACMKTKIKSMSSNERIRLMNSASHLNAWSNVDDYCLSLSQPLFLLHKEEVTHRLREWNQSSEIWLQRCSLVPLSRKVAFSGEHFPLIRELCERLKFSEKDLIRKAIGWVLKDSLNGDYQSTFPYLKKIRGEGASGLISSYAMRNLKPDDKEVIKTLGKSIQSR